jgi:hypothetical protein
VDTSTKVRFDKFPIDFRQPLINPGAVAQIPFRLAQTSKVFVSKGITIFFLWGEA